VTPLNGNKGFRADPPEPPPAGEGWGPFERVVRFIRHDIWYVNVADLGPVRAYLTRVLRVVVITARGFHRDKCLQQSAALTYLTIFALPAFLALAFAIAKGFNAFETLKKGPIDGFLDRAFPLQMEDGSPNESSLKIREVVDQVFEYVQNADLKLLGVIGVLFLFYTTLKMLGSVEASFNEIWGVSRSRALLRKFSDYLAILLVTPVVLLVGTAFTGFLSSFEKIHPVFFTDTDLKGPVLAMVPIASICLGMTLVLMTLPNTRVRIVPAFLGGILAGVGWQMAQLGFLEFQLGLARANAVFSSFAAVPLLLLWIYISWVVVFAGSELSFAVQNERAITTMARTGVVDQRFKDAVGPRLAGRITAAFLSGAKPPSVVELAAELGVSPRAVALILETLARRRILVETSEAEDEGYLPARDPDTITVLDLLHAMREEEGANPVPTRDRLDERVDRILEGFDHVLRSSLHNYTLRELAQVALEEGEPSASEPGSRSAGEAASAAEGPSG